MEKKKIKIETRIAVPAAVILIGVIFIGFVFPEFFNKWMLILFDVTTKNFGWFYLIISMLLLFLCLYIALTPFGSKIIGDPGDKPEFSLFSWCAMTVCSGIATAMVFYAVGEPLTYFYNPPAFTGLESQSPQAAVRGVQLASYHWSFIYYGVFTFWGLCVGYMSMNHHLPFRPSSGLYPILKDKIYGPIGQIIDIVSLLALIGGVVTSLGFGTTQFASGLQFVFGIEPTNLMYAITIIFVTLSFTISSGRGLKKGMKIISDINAYIYIILTIFLFVFGPTTFLFNLLTETMGSMLINFIPNGFNADPFDVGNGWSRMNTIFFMAWIMAYAPLVGLFLAKISRGRTIRQFLMINIFVPGSFVFIWFTAFGGNAIYADYYEGANIWGVIEKMGFPVSNFALLDKMPLRMITIPLVIIVLFFSFITLADAMTGTIASMTVKDTLAEEAPVRVKLFWGLLIGASTLLCLFALGEIGTTALQNMSIVYALPIFIVTLIAIASVMRMVNGRVDREMEEERLAKSAPKAPEAAEPAKAQQ